MVLNVFKRRVDIIRDRQTDRDRERQRVKTRVTYGNSGTPGDTGVNKHNN